MTASGTQEVNKRLIKRINNLIPRIGVSIIGSIIVYISILLLLGNPVLWHIKRVIPKSKTNNDNHY